ncbi:hypothetical protein BH11GEM2_BH11GEM2_06660 [soil metagenome]
MRKPSRSSPAPRTASAKALEYVRAHERIPSLRGFWETLGGKASGVSYEAVRNYHYDRKAPMSYLLLVAKKFPRYSLEYLAGTSQLQTEAHAPSSVAVGMSGGNANALEHEEERREDVHRMLYFILEAVGIPQAPVDVELWRSGNAQLPYWTAALAELRRRVWWNYMVRLDREQMHEDRFQAEAWIGKAIRSPLLALGLDPARMDDDAFADYVTALMPALLRAADAMKEDHWQPSALSDEAL